jgi:hypothetical protein
MNTQMTPEAWWKSWCDESGPQDWYAEIIATESFKAGRTAGIGFMRESLLSYADALEKVCDAGGGLDSDAAVIGFARAFAGRM